MADFTAVSNQVKNWSKKPADAENLALYSLYKQATVGDINIPTPTDLVGKAKWNAWNERKGISQEDAKKQYVDLAKQWHSKYA